MDIIYICKMKDTFVEFIAYFLCTASFKYFNLLFGRTETNTPTIL